MFLANFQKCINGKVCWTFFLCVLVWVRSHCLLHTNFIDFQRLRLQLPNILQPYMQSSSSTSFDFIRVPLAHVWHFKWKTPSSCLSSACQCACLFLPVHLPHYRSLSAFFLTSVLGLYLSGWLAIAISIHCVGQAAFNNFEWQLFQLEFQ